MSFYFYWVPAEGITIDVESSFCCFIHGRVDIHFYAYHWIIIAVSLTMNKA